MASIKVISFDLDGTLFDTMFVDTVWLEEIPRLYAVKKRVSVDEATKIVKKEYDKVGKDRVEWYDIHYWIRRFGLNVKAKELLRSFQHKIRPYPEVPKVLDRFRQKGFGLIVITNAGREFAELELEKANIKKYFNRVFSSTSDFGVVKKTVKLYQTVCKMLGVLPQEIVHVGDDWKFDFHVPNALGILAFYLDRTGEQQGEFVIHSLGELNKKLEKAQAEHV